MSDSEWKSGVNAKSLFERLGVPEELWELMQFAGIGFRNVEVSHAAAMMGIHGDKIFDRLDNWVMVMPTQERQIEVPLPHEISKDDPVGHWRALMAAGADFQYLVNSGQYTPG